MKTPERRHGRPSEVFNVNFEHSQNFFSCFYIDFWQLNICMDARPKSQSTVKF